MSPRMVALLIWVLICLTRHASAALVSGEGASSTLNCRNAVKQAPTAPDAFGVNIHFTDPRAGEMKMLAEGGFHWVRLDFSWSRTEKTKGEYDFTPYDRLLTALDTYGICALFNGDLARLVATKAFARTNPKALPIEEDTVP